MATMRPYPEQRDFREWLDGQGIKHSWAAARLGYSTHYLSRVINGTAPLTDKFRQRCADTLEVPNDVWLIGEPAVG